MLSKKHLCAREERKERKEKKLEMHRLADREWLHDAKYFPRGVLEARRNGDRVSKKNGSFDGTPRLLSSRATRR